MTTLSLADGIYEVEQIGEIDNPMFNVYKDDECICTLGIIEHGEWEANNSIDESLVKQLGQEIEISIQFEHRGKKYSGSFSIVQIGFQDEWYFDESDPKDDLKYLARFFGNYVATKSLLRYQQ